MADDERQEKAKDTQTTAKRDNHTDTANQVDKANTAKRPNKPEQAHQAGKADKTKRTAKAKKSKKADKSKQTRQADKANQTEQAATAKQVDKSDKTDTAEETDKSDQTKPVPPTKDDSAQDDSTQDAAPTITVALPPRPSDKPADTASATGNQDNPDDQDQPAKSKKNIIRAAIIAAVALIVIAAIGAFGYHYYTTHSRSYAISRYEKATQRLKDSQKQLDATIAKTDKTAGSVNESDVKRPTVVTTYTTTVRESRKTVKVRTLTKTQLQSLDVEQINKICNELEQAAAHYSASSGKVNDSAQQVMDAKADADKALSPVEHAIAAAEQQKKQNDAEAKKNGLDLKAIASGDYSSLNGTWTNPDGAWMKISNGNLTPQNPVQGTTPPYRLKEPTANNTLFNPEHLSEIPKTQHTLLQDGARVDRPSEAPDIYFLVTVQRGAKLYNASPSFSPQSYVGDDPTDSSRDRIIPANASANQGQTPFCASASCAYYRDGGSVSAASQQKLKDKVDQANKLMAGLDQKWQQGAKTNFQCRIDVVNGANKTCESTSGSSGHDGTANVEQLRRGDFSSISGQWCTSGNDCVTIGKDGSYSNGDGGATQAKLAIATENNWVTGGVGGTGIVELMDTRGPICVDPNVTYPNCTMAEVMWPTDFVYYPKNVPVCPNADICTKAYEGTENDPDDIDISRPHMELMARHMNPRPTMADTYYFVGGDQGKKSSKSSKGMNIKQIGQNDCSSIAGHWVNADGTSIDLHDSCPSGSYTDGSGHPTQWQRPVLHDGYAEQANTSDTSGGAEDRVFVPAGQSMPAFALRNFQASSDDSDTSKDRIFTIAHGIGAQTPRDPAEWAFYKQ
ncbi:DUF6287 domain-containing protein [Bifidobacterium sp. ESL0790]|uniref:DUF6287 domain-containing protein n=1 Tax=Bifidobacterium sp. ESL0790 TaxID=2983233 RepID=UPI0023F8A011|nr:DUF6287 domain-containing protein [Bifidobacterium sp. ESL0790]WEV72966.1 DUF6287 domain-containing protein [Bifidobacterium sp. ESL0790]